MQSPTSSSTVIILTLNAPQCRSPRPPIRQHFHDARRSPPSTSRSAAAPQTRLPLWLQRTPPHLRLQTRASSALACQHPPRRMRAQVEVATTNREGGRAASASFSQTSTAVAATRTAQSLCRSRERPQHGRRGSPPPTTTSSSRHSSRSTPSPIIRPTPRLPRQPQLKTRTPSRIKRVKPPFARSTLVAAAPSPPPCSAPRATRRPSTKMIA